MGLQVEGMEGTKKHYTLDVMIEEVKKLKEVQEVLGFKEPGWLDALKNPQVIVGLLEVAASWIGPRLAPAADGGLPRTNSEGMRLSQEQRLKLMGQSASKTQGNEVNNPARDKSADPAKPKDPTPEPDTPHEAKEGGKESGPSVPNG